MGIYFIYLFILFYLTEIQRLNFILPALHTIKRKVIGQRLICKLHTVEVSVKILVKELYCVALPYTDLQLINAKQWRGSDRC